MKASIFVKALIAVAVAILVSGCSHITYTRLPGGSVAPADIEPLQRMCRKEAISNQGIGNTESDSGHVDETIIGRLYEDCMADNGYKVTCKVPNTTGGLSKRYLGCGGTMLFNSIIIEKEIIIDGNDVTKRKLN